MGTTVTHTHTHTVPRKNRDGQERVGHVLRWEPAATRGLGYVLRWEPAAEHGD